MINTILSYFKMQIEGELKNNILKFWIDNTQDIKNGGFYGYISNDLKVKADHEKASVLNSRILWTFSAAYRLFGDEKYHTMAIRSFEYIKKYFVDYEYSGVYWLLDYNGCPANTKKQVYAMAFAIYGLSEYHRATGDTTALALAVELFESLEGHARDRQNKGYHEALARDWSPLADKSLSPKDMNVAKSMNTHLHILEAYTNLLKVWDSPILKKSLKELLEVTLEHIVDNDSWSFRLFFDLDWTSRANNTSYGHDIEGSWLVHEAAEVLGDAELLKRTKNTAIYMAQRVLNNGIDIAFGGIYNDRHESGLDDNKDWWPQAEAVVGFFNAYQLTGSDIYLEASLQVWDYIQKHIVDKVNGEWFWGVTRDGSQITSDEKVGPWKCPYHNSRMCYEIITRVEKISRVK